MGVPRSWLSRGNRLGAWAHRRTGGLTGGGSGTVLVLTVPMPSATVDVELGEGHWSVVFSAPSTRCSPSRRAR